MIFFSSYNNAWWHQVTEISEHNKIIVFNKGIWYGLKIIILFRGQFLPISIIGDKFYILYITSKNS